MDLISELAELAMATRLKRLSERLAQDVNKIYKELDFDFEAKWFLVLELLSRRKVLSIVDIADELRLTHPAIVQFVDQMQKAKLITAKKDQIDGRKRMVCLTAKGKRMLDELAPVLALIKQEIQRLLSQADHNLLSVLGQIEDALDEENLYSRIKAHTGELAGARSKPNASDEA
ncbi:MarR family transcriptional regulator [Mucilaginibacter daejeonensis]|uniref:MarR family winged helix-turn-helix transcriptional regulator n=1 Tax=Mucilaginibacter daejeonensis TaxID=398049 RepID=UPI001D17A10A|nr:MarR family transcriptional regulator [Mucilaginibacter daejeonensis]UEG53206.1 MarR family transcriptional regulator [Mucilaginibacter daejeonensis]